MAYIKKTIERLQNWTPILLILFLASVIGALEQIYSPISGLFNQENTTFHGEIVTPGIHDNIANADFAGFLNDNIGKVVDLELEVQSIWGVGAFAVECESNDPETYFTNIGRSAPSDLVYSFKIYVVDSSVFDKTENPEDLYVNGPCGETHYITITVPAQSVNYIKSAMATQWHLLKGKFLVSLGDKWGLYMTLSKLD